MDFIFNLSKAQKILIVVGIFWGLSGEGTFYSIIGRGGENIWWAGLVAIAIGIFLAGDKSQYESIKEASPDLESLWAEKKRKEKEEKEDESGIVIFFIIALISAPLLILIFV